jgi:hypothetical protein
VHVCVCVPLVQLADVSSRAAGAVPLSRVLTSGCCCDSSRAWSTVREMGWRAAVWRYTAVDKCFILCCRRLLTAADRLCGIDDAVAR